MLRERARGGRADASGSSSRQVGIPDARPLPASLARPPASTRCSTAASTASAARRGRATPTCPAAHRAPGGRARRGRRARRRRARSRACSRSAPPRASPSSRSAAAPASSAACDPCAARFERLISLDLRRLRAVSVDERSLVATLGPGLRGPEAERALGERGLTLGHFPQSFEYATIGGFAATRSAGQASSGYGRFDDMVTSVALAAPAGELRTLDVPHTAAGPALRELVVGSEGTLGVITEVGVRVRPAPAEHRYEAWVAPDFESGTRDRARAGPAGRAAGRGPASPTRPRPRRRSAWPGSRGPQRRALDAYLRLRRRARRLHRDHRLGGRAPRPSARRRALAGAAAARRRRGLRSGTRPGEAWLRGRYEGPYLRESCSTSATWSRRWRPRTRGRA